MKFDVIVGNPPYQLNDGGCGGLSAVPLYHKFVLQAKKLNPKCITMIIPARWYSGGRGLNDFRKEMLNDKRIKKIVDFENAKECFPDVDIAGGVCYFLWDRHYKGKTEVYTSKGGKIKYDSERFLLENGAETFIRFNKAISILHKVQVLQERSFADMISTNDPFGFDVRVEGSYKRVKPEYKKEPFKGSVKLYYNGWQKKGMGYIDKGSIRRNVKFIEGYKVLIPKAWGVGSMEKDWIKPLIVEPNSCCTETYLILGPFAKRIIAENVVSYIQTKFFHLLVFLIKTSQNAMKKVYSFVPMQDFNEVWTDEKLYKKYGLTEEEIAFIEKTIKPTNLVSNDGE